MPVDGASIFYQKRAMRVAEQIRNGNLTDAFDILFDDEDPAGVVLAVLRLVELLTLDGTRTTPSVTRQLIAMITNWSDD
jgi:hypothetical protein